MGKYRVLAGVLLLAVTGAALTGCGSKVSKDNYDKIKDGMTLKEVEGLLGKGEVQTDLGGSIGSVTGSAKVVRWSDGDKSITVTFVNDKATVKTSSGL